MNFDLIYIFDFFVILIIAVSTLLSLWKGLLKELFNILVWIIGILSAITLFPYLTPYTDIYLSFKPLSKFISWIIPFIIIIIILGIINKVIISPLFIPFNGITNSILGMTFGFIRGLLIFCLIYYILKNVPDVFSITDKHLNETFSYPLIKFISEKLLETFPSLDFFNFTSNLVTANQTS